MNESVTAALRPRATDRPDAADDAGNDARESDPTDLARLHHDLSGPVAVFGGFLDELRDAVEQLARADTPVPVEVIDRLLDEDFRPCLACLDDALLGMRAAIDGIPIDDAGTRDAA